MGAKIEDDTQAKKGEIEAEPPEKKVKVSNAQDGEAKELKQRRTSYKRLGISEDEAEKLLKSEDANSGRRTRSRSRGGVTESPRAAKKTTPAKETPSKRGPKGKKAAPAPAATSAEEDEEAPTEESAEKAEEPAKDDEPKEEEAAAAEDGDDEAAAKEEEAVEEDGDAAEPAKEESEEKDTDDGDAKKE